MTVNEETYFHRLAKQHREGGGIFLFYQFDTETGAVAPGSGQVAAGGTWATLKLSTTDRDSNAIADVLDEIAVGTYLMVRSQERPEEFVLLEVTAYDGSFDGDTWRRWACTIHYSTGTASWAEDDYVTVSLGVGGGDGSAAGEYHVHAFQEDLSAECDGVKVNFITANQFEEDTLNVFEDGALLRVGLTKDYTEDWPYDNFTLAVAPVGTLTVEYLVELGE